MFLFTHHLLPSLKDSTNTDITGVLRIHKKKEKYAWDSKSRDQLISLKLIDVWRYEIKNNKLTRNHDDFKKWVFLNDITCIVEYDSDKDNTLLLEHELQKKRIYDANSQRTKKKYTKNMLRFNHGHNFTYGKYTFETQKI